MQLKKIKSYSEVLSSWNKVDFGHVQTKIHDKEDALGCYLELARDGGFESEIKDCMDDLLELQGHEEQLWRQHSCYT